MSMVEGRKMDVVVTGIRPGDSATSYIVDMTIDGTIKSFRFEVRLPHLMSVGIERAFEEIFRGVRGGRRIASLVLNYHKGEPIEFPVALEIIDFKQPKPSP
jgi:hypothetical protein